jgi:hypothetical protein
VGKELVLAKATAAIKVKVAFRAIAVGRIPPQPNCPGQPGVLRDDPKDRPRLVVVLVKE